MKHFNKINYSKIVLKINYAHLLNPNNNLSKISNIRFDILKNFNTLCDIVIY